MNLRAENSLVDEDQIQVLSFSLIGLLHRLTKYSALVVFIFSLLIGIAFQGTRGLYESSEGRYAEVAREMVVSGDYIHPTLDGHPHLTKPPFTYWAIAIGLKLFGNNEWGARLANVIALAFTALAVYFFGRLLANNTLGLLAGMIYSSSLYPVIGANVLSADTLLAMWTTVAFVLFVYSFMAKDSDLKKSFYFCCFAWVALGFAFLTKSVASFIPFLCLPFWFFFYKERIGRRYLLVNLLGVIFFFIIGLGWYFKIFFENPAGSSTLNSFSIMFEEQIKGRLISNEFHRNSKWYAGFLIYLPILLLGPGIWSFIVSRGIRRVSLGQVKEYFIENKLFGLLFLWATVPLLVFFVAKSKLPFYLLPCYPAVATLIAFFLFKLDSKDSGVSELIRTSLITAYCLILLKGFAAFYPNVHNMRDLSDKCKVILKHHSRETEVVVVDQSKLNGLAFYLQRKLLRVSSEGGIDNINSLTHLLTLNQNLHKHYLLVFRRNDAAEVREPLRKANLFHQQWRVGDWELVYLG